MLKFWGPPRRLEVGGHIICQTRAACFSYLEEEKAEGDLVGLSSLKGRIRRYGLFPEVLNERTRGDSHKLQGNFNWMLEKKNQTEDGQCGNRLPGESGYFHPQRFSKCDWKWVCATCSDIEFEQRLDKTTSEMLLQHKLCYSYSTIMHLSILLNLSKPKNKYSLKVSCFSLLSWSIITCKEQSSRGSYCVKCYKDQWRLHSFCFYWAQVTYMAFKIEINNAKTLPLWIFPWQSSPFLSSQHKKLIKTYQQNR